MNDGNLRAPEPSAPYSNQDVLSDGALRDLARGRSEWANGQISQADQLFLTMVLQDMAGELLAFRLHNASIGVAA